MFMCVDLSGYVCTGDHVSRVRLEKWGRALGHYDMKSEKRLQRSENIGEEAHGGINKNNF